MPRRKGILLLNPIILRLLGDEVPRKLICNPQDCLRDMILPTMMRVQDKVNFTLSFIGTYVCHRSSEPR